MIRTALVATSKSPFPAIDFDGGSGALLHLLAELASANVSVRHLLLRYPFSIPPNFSSVGVHFLPPLHLPGGRCERRLANAARTREAIAHFGEECDVIIVSHLSNAFTLEEAPLPIRHRTIVLPMFTGLSMQRSGDPVTHEYLESERRALNACAGVVCPSEADRMHIIEGYGVRPNRIVCIQHVIDSTMFPFRIRTRFHTPLRVLYVANIREQKNHGDALLMLVHLRNLGVRAELWCAGGASGLTAQRKFNAQAAALRITDAVRNFGVVAQRALAALFAECDIGISVSRHETFGLGILEGLSSGVPTVVYEDLASIREFATPAPGMAFVVRDPARMAAQIATWARHRDVAALSQSAGDVATLYRRTRPLGMLLPAVKRLLDAAI